MYKTNQTKANPITQKRLNAEQSKINTSKSNTFALPTKRAEHKRGHSERERDDLHAEATNQPHRLTTTRHRLVFLCHASSPNARRPLLDYLIEENQRQRCCVAVVRCVVACVFVI
jgi:hypothetical protein